MEAMDIITLVTLQGYALGAAVILLLNGGWKEAFRARGGRRTGAAAGLEQLRAERRTILVDMEKYNTPSTFVQYAKMQRQAQNREKEIRTIEEADAKRAKELKRLLTNTFRPLTALMFVMVWIQYGRAPILSFDCALVWPLGGTRLLFRGGEDGRCGLSAPSWLFLCISVFFRLLERVFHARREVSSSAYY